MALRILLLVAMMWAVTSVLAQTVGTGHISGQVTDKNGGVLPGVRVTVAGPTLHRVAITDADGRFDVEGLVQGWPSTYTITAELVGFVSTALEKITAHVGGVVNVPVALEVGPLCEVDWVDFKISGEPETCRLGPPRADRVVDFA